MNQVATYNVHALSTVVSPLTHMSGTSGNEAMINREPVFYNGQTRNVPVLSGNALRHRMVREPGADYLVEQLGLYGDMTIDQYNYLYNGGSLTESSISDNLKKIGHMQTLFPLLRLIGGSLRNQIIGGSLVVKRGVLVCEENRAQITPQLPDGYELPPDMLRSSEDFIGHYQYTRGDATKRSDASAAVSEEIPEDRKSSMMPYSGQQVNPGAVFYHGFVLNNVSMLEVGALLLSLQKWADDHGTVGGSARIGHGKIDTSIWIDAPHGDDYGGTLDPVELTQAYMTHVTENREACVQWLNDAFPEKKK